MKRLLPVFFAARLCAQTAIAPLSADGKPLNLGFESGSLEGWTATGDAFTGQPVKGDTVKARRGDMASQHVGTYWIGTYEIGQDAGKGTLTSVAFPVTKPWASFLVGGGDWPETRVEIVTKDDGKVIHTARGSQEENLRRSVVDLRKFQGRDIFLRIVDEREGHWGHINFDDFVFHAEEPKLPAATVAKVGLVPDVVAHAGLKPEEVPGAATVPPGYELTVFAAEPEIVNPISFCQDDRGRLWVVEGLTYPTKAKEGEGKDRILVFEDTDGDGKADKRTVFQEGLNLVSGIEVGFGGVFVGAAPNLLFIPVKDWDNPKPAGQPEILLDGFGYQDTHETLNTFHWGPDGWLYGCHGVFTNSAVGRPGASEKERVKINAGIWRYHPGRKTFELYGEGTSNPWGIDWNADGDLFCEACVIPHLFHIFPGGRYTRQAGQHFDPHTYADIETIADHRHYLGATPHGGNGKSDAAGGGHAHAGLCILQHPSWPEGLRGGVLMNNIHGARINMDILERKGSGFVAHHGADFINFHDTASQIVDLREGPEGTLFMIDWYDMNQCHNPRREAHDYTTGRIYRLAKKGAKVPVMDLAAKSSDALGALIVSPDEWQWRHAARLLQERIPGGDWLKEFNQSLPAAGDTADAGRKILLRWLELRAALSDGQPGPMPTAKDFAFAKALPAEALACAIRLSEPAQLSVPAILEFLADQAKNSPSPIVRLAIAQASRRIAVEGRKPIVAALLAHAEDATDINLPFMDWYAAEPIVAADPAWAAEALATCKIPKVGEFIARRLSDK